MLAGKKQWVPAWGLAVTELKTREGMGKRRASTELGGISRKCVVEENSPGVRGAGETCSAACMVAAWVLQVASRKGSQDPCLRRVNREEQKLGKMLGVGGGSVSSQQYRKEREKSLEAAEQSQPPGRRGEERT